MPNWNDVLKEIQKEISTHSVAAQAGGRHDRAYIVTGDVIDDSSGYLIDVLA